MANGNGNSTNRLLLIASVIIGITVIVGVVTLAVMRPGGETLTIIGLITVFITTGMASMVAAVKSMQTSDKVVKTDEKIQQLSVNVDGRLTKLLELTARASEKEGAERGRREQMERTDFKDAQVQSGFNAGVEIGKQIPTPAVPPVDVPVFKAALEDGDSKLILTTEFEADKKVVEYVKKHGGK
jgi:hypothetical protein